MTERLIFNTKELNRVFVYLQDIGFIADKDRIFKHYPLELSFERDEFYSIDGHISSSFNEISIRFFCTSFDDFKDFYQRSFLFLEAKVKYKTDSKWVDFCYHNGKFVSLVKPTKEMDGYVFKIVSNNEINHVFKKTGTNSDVFTPTSKYLTKLPVEYEPKHCRVFHKSYIEEIKNFLSGIEIMLSY